MGFGPSSLLLFLKFYVFCFTFFICYAFASLLVVLVEFFNDKYFVHGLGLLLSLWEPQTLLYMYLVILLIKVFYLFSPKKKKKTNINIKIFFFHINTLIIFYKWLNLLLLLLLFGLKDYILVEICTYNFFKTFNNLYRFF